MNHSSQTKGPAIYMWIWRRSKRVDFERRILEWLLQIPELVVKTIQGSFNCPQTLPLRNFSTEHITFFEKKIGEEILRRNGKISIFLIVNYLDRWGSFLHGISCLFICS